MMLNIIISILLALTVSSMLGVPGVPKPHPVNAPLEPIYVERNYD